MNPIRGTRYHKRGEVHSRMLLCRAHISEAFESEQLWRDCRITICARTSSGSSLLRSRRCTKRSNVKPGLPSPIPPTHHPVSPFLRRLRSPPHRRAYLRVLVRVMVACLASAGPSGGAMHAQTSDGLPSSAILSAANGLLGQLIQAHSGHPSLHHAPVCIQHHAPSIKRTPGTPTSNCCTTATSLLRSSTMQ